ncbi:PhzF family phenazine biosynthesis protein [Paenibacillus sp. J5C_2022]|uniref:PhzF family phenazine biosynthesis protein n=1 Tax=Paenibacillus sp. J5C2022 TaxID=2977129 RepID=UPI0021D085E4|nr:PhzF family phenazine biosynthesis protein [Paenibacillus sp. J5C2022]MCU6707415.1 PhzF family phenazine biosynthesis protein [Paenibacillus sp. J5C2022]
MNIYIVDAFTNEPFRGNPAAVCMLEQEKSEQWMQQVAGEMNLSETAFVIRRDCGDGYTLRWFTPVAEVELCGHATLAAAHLLWERSGVDDQTIAFHTKSGVLHATRQGHWIQLNFPLELEQECVPPPQLIVGLGERFHYIGRNRMDYLIEVEDESVLRALKPNFQEWSTVKARGIIVTCKAKMPDVDFVSRCFYPVIGVNEDPVTGSAHCCLAPYWQKKLGKSSFTAVQLSRREGLLTLRIENDRILMSGQAVTTLAGRLANI